MIAAGYRLPPEKAKAYEKAFADKPAVLALVKKAGYEVVDISNKVPLPDQIEAIFGKRAVDCGVDCVGFEAHGYGPSAEEDPAAVINGLLEVVRAPAGIGLSPQRAASMMAPRHSSFASSSTQSPSMPCRLA